MTTRDQQELADAHKLEQTITAAFKDFVVAAERAMNKSLATEVVRAEFTGEVKLARKILKVMER